MKEAESVTTQLSRQKAAGPGGLTSDFHQSFKLEITRILCNLFQTQKQRQHFLTHSEARITLIPKPKMLQERKITDRCLTNTNIKMLSKTQANQTQPWIKRLIHHRHAGFIPGMQGGLSVQTSKMMHRTPGVKTENHIKRCLRSAWRNWTSIRDFKKILSEK